MVRINGTNISSLAMRWTGKNIEAEIAKLKQYGFNGVRAPIYWAWINPAKGVIDENYYTNGANGNVIPLDQLVAACAAQGMYLQLQLARSQYIKPTWTFSGIPIDQEWDSMMSGASPDELEAIRMIWRSVAQRYADNAYIIFDLFNEPNYASTIPRTTFFSNFIAFMQSLVAELEAIETAIHIKTVQKVFYAGEMQIPGNICREFHFYTPDKATYDRATQYTTIRDQFKSNYANLHALGQPVVIGEFARMLYPAPLGGDAEWFEDMFKIFSECNINHWFVHSYSYSADEEYSIINPDGTPRQPSFDAIRQELLQPPPPVGKGYIEIHAYLDSQEIVVPFQVVETGLTGNTPQTVEVDFGTYTVKATLVIEIQQKTGTVLEGQTIKFDFMFKNPMVSIDVVAGAGGTTSPSGSQTLNAGQTYYFTASPQSGYLFDHWQLDGLSIGSTNPLPLTITTDMDGKILTALFSTVPPPRITITVAISGNGTTNLTPGQHQFNVGDTVSIIAIPQAGNGFKQWQINGTIYTDNPISLTVTDDLNGKTLTAEFVSLAPIQAGFPIWIIPVTAVLLIGGYVLSRTGKNRKG